MNALRRFAPLILLALLSGCGSSAANAPKPALTDAVTTRAPKREEPVKLIAPPPAYGNKIVLAESDAVERPVF